MFSTARVEIICVWLADSDETVFYNARQRIGSESKTVCTSQKPQIVHVEYRLLKSS